MKKIHIISAVALLGAVSPVYAATLAEMQAAIDFSTVISMIFAVGLLVIGVDLAQIGYMKARKMITGSVRG